MIKVIFHWEEQDAGQGTIVSICYVIELTLKVKTPPLWIKMTLSHYGIRINLRARSKNKRAATVLLLT